MGVERSTTTGEREWWRRALRVSLRPREVFTALRDDSDEAAQARAEPVLALVLLAGIGGILATNAAAQILDDFDLDAALVAVWAFVSGLLYGLAGFWLLGALVLAGIRIAGGHSGYRRARHAVAFAAAPIALTLVLWPLRLAIYGDDVFRTGGRDGGALDAAFEAVEVAAVVWTLALLLVAVKTIEPFGWGRAIGAVALPAVVPALAIAAAVGLL